MRRGSATSRETRKSGLQARVFASYPPRRMTGRSSQVSWPCWAVWARWLRGNSGGGSGFLVGAAGCADRAITLGATPPPGCAVRSCLSASGLQALTHSPLLFQGKTPSSQRKDARGNLLAVLETSPGSN